MTASLARKMCVQHNYSCHLLDDGMPTAGCYCHHACGTHDVDGRHGLATYLQELLESKSRTLYSSSTSTHLCS